MCLSSPRNTKTPVDRSSLFFGHAYLESLTGKGVTLQLNNPAIPRIAELAGGFHVPTTLPDFLRFSLGNFGALFGAVPRSSVVKRPHPSRKPVHPHQLRRHAAIRRVGRVWWNRWENKISVGRRPHERREEHQERKPRNEKRFLPHTGPPSVFTIPCDLHPPDVRRRVPRQKLGNGFVLAFLPSKFSLARCLQLVGLLCVTLLRQSTNFQNRGIHWGVGRRLSFLLRRVQERVRLLVRLLLFRGSDC